MISFIIPAHNEEALIGRTLSALHESARALGETYEVIVANDTSTDRTAAVALEHRARVVAVNRRQIAATRNAGARAAMGEMFIFVDADTVVTARGLCTANQAVKGTQGNIFVVIGYLRSRVQHPAGESNQPLKIPLPELRDRGSVALPPTAASSVKPPSKRARGRLPDRHPPHRARSTAAGCRAAGPSARVGVPAW